jgi:hypothetical protein
MNETAITIIGLLLLTGAMAKSAQIPLHSWLPGSMEGFKGVKHYISIIIYIIFFYIYIYSDHSYDFKYSSLLPIFSIISTSTLYTITGNMLGDGSISLSKVNNKYRIRISKTSMDRVIFLVKPYMHIDFLYKLGI